MSSKSSYSSSSRRHTHDRKSARSRSPRRSKKEERHKHENKSSKKDIQRGIDKAKNLLKSSLNEAIDDIKSLESSRNVAVKQERQDTSDIIVDSVSRQEAIERIDNPGFKPCSFKSDADSGRSTSSKNSENVTLISSATTQHDRAMFGPLWANKKIVEKCTKKDVNATKKRVVDEQKDAKEEEEEKNVPLSRFPLAHEKLSEDPEIRNQRWLELFRERRKLAIEGIL